jgi:pimeloyl-ACP methyl ester carboxylesterase
MAKRGKPARTGAGAKKGGFFAAIRAQNPAFMLGAALLICLISGAGAYLSKTAGGSIALKKLHWETPSGHLQNALLFVPKTASKTNPAPAVVTAHGWGNNMEVQTPNYVELSRRGYVVLAIDLYGHGDSDNLPVDTWFEDDTNANGVYDAVKLLASLPYVDAAQIGVEGHSNGAYLCNLAVLLDNKAPKPLISSVLLECNDAIYTEKIYYGQFFDAADTNYTNIYGNRSVAIVAAKYDEAFHRIAYPGGTLTAPRDFLYSALAQSFLHFGADPSGLEERQGDTFYVQNIDGKEALRIMYTPAVLHMWAFMSKKVTGEFIEFFQKAMPAPAAKAPGNQVWQWKAFFEAMGIIGLFMFFVNFIAVLLKTKFFGTLGAKEPVRPAVVDRKGKAWLWRGLVLNALFSAISFPVMWAVGLLNQVRFFNQWHPWVLGLWSLVTGLFALLIMFLNYRRYAKPRGLNLRKQGVFLSGEAAIKSILLGLLTAAAVYAIVFAADYFFAADYCLWAFFSFRAFDANKLPVILKFAPFFVFFYVIHSIAMNVFNYIQIGKKEWVNTLILCIFSALGTVILLAAFYIPFLITGLLPVDRLAWGLGTMIMWTYPMAAVLPTATVLNRIIYKKTRNPYIGGIAFSLMVTTMLCNNTLTYLI